MARKRYLREQDDRRGCPSIEYQRTDLLPLAPRIRRHGSRSSPSPERARSGKPTVEEAGRRPGSGHLDPEGSLPGKLLSPTRRAQAVGYVCQVLTVSERRACREGLERPIRPRAGKAGVSWKRGAVPVRRGSTLRCYPYYMAPVSRCETTPQKSTTVEQRYRFLFHKQPGTEICTGCL